MRGRGEALQHPRHRVVGFIVEAEGLAHRVVVAEILLRHGLGEDHRVGLGEGCFWIALDQGEGEDVEDRRVGQQDVVFVELMVFVGDQGASGIQKAHGVEHLRILLNQRSSHRRRRGGRVNERAANRALEVHAVDPVGVFVVAVVAEFVLDVEHDQHAGRHPNRQPGNVDERVALMLLKMAERDLEIILEHGGVGWGSGEVDSHVTRRQAPVGYSRRE